MFIVAIIVLVVAMAAAAVSAIFFTEDAAALGIAIGLIAAICLMGGIALLTTTVKEQTSIQVKTEVLKHLTYTESVTLTPKGDKFFFILNDSTMVELYEYLTSNPYTKRKD